MNQMFTTWWAESLEATAVKTRLLSWKELCTKGSFPKLKSGETWETVQNGDDPSGVGTFF